MDYRTLFSRNTNLWFNSFLTDDIETIAVLLTAEYEGILLHVLLIKHNQHPGANVSLHL